MITSMRYNQNKYYDLFLISFITILIGSNLAAGKICNFFGMQLDAGTALFPALYVISDLVAEVYGYQQSRKMIITALACNIVLSLFLLTTTAFPAYPDIMHNQSYDLVYSMSLRIFYASMISYFIGEMLNLSILSYLRQVLGGRYFVLRALVSTMIGATIESFVFCSIAFSDLITSYEIAVMSMTLSGIKVLYEILVMPLVILILRYLSSATAPKKRA